MQILNYSDSCIRWDSIDTLMIFRIFRIFCLWLKHWISDLQVLKSPRFTEVSSWSLLQYVVRILVEFLRYFYDLQDWSSVAEILEALGIKLPILQNPRFHRSVLMKFYSNVLWNLLVDFSIYFSVFRITQRWFLPNLTLNISKSSEIFRPNGRESH